MCLREKIDPNAIAVLQQKVSLLTQFSRSSLRAAGGGSVKHPGVDAPVPPKKAVLTDGLGEKAVDVADHIAIEKAAGCAGARTQSHRLRLGSRFTPIYPQEFYATTVHPAPLPFRRGAVTSYSNRQPYGRAARDSSESS
jgi:hypothetical protein